MDLNPYESPQVAKASRTRRKKPKRLDLDDPWLTFFFVICLSALLLLGLFAFLSP
jgi:hypothetical protein